MNLIDLGEEFVATNVFNPNTAEAIRGILDLFARRSGVFDIRNVDLRAVGNFKENCLSVARPVTYNGYLKYLRLIGDYAVERKIVNTNLFRRLPLAPVGKPPKKHHHSSEITYIENWLEANPQYLQPNWFWLALIKTLHYTGMRRRQLTQLRLKDLDFIRYEIALRYEGSKTLREWNIPMHEKLVETLEIYINQYERIAGRALKSEDYIFSIYRFNPRYKHKNSNDPMKPRQITGYFQRLSKRIGFTTGAHRFRHSLATLLCNPEDG